MEIEGEDGSKIFIKKGSKTEFGRGLGFISDDRTVSRRHISFELFCRSREKDRDNEDNPDTEPTRVSFEVLGRNPIWVCGGRGKDIRVFRNSNKGEMSVGDCFYVSAKKKPILFTLKIIGFDGGEDNEERVLKEDEVINRNSSEDHEMMEIIASDDGESKGGENLGFGSLDVSEIDPVKEFGFVVMGHEFDNYPKQMIRDIKNLDWCIEEPKEGSEDDETTMRNRSKRKKGVRGKKNDIEKDDDDWTGDSEDEKVLISNLRKDKRPRYSKTRSKDPNKPIKDMGSSSSILLAHKKTVRANEDDDEDEDNLGGFIVNDEELEEEDDLSGEEDEEEKYDEDEDEEEEEDDLSGEEET